MSPAEVAVMIESITGRKPTVSSIQRWIVHGVGGIRLAAKRCGWLWAIDPAAVREFLDRLNRETVGA